MTGEPRTEAPRRTACHPPLSTAQSRMTTAVCGLCAGWFRPPTFVPNSDGTVAAGEGLVLAGEPSSHVPGLGEREKVRPRGHR